MPAEGSYPTVREREALVMRRLAEAILAGALAHMDRVPGRASSATSRASPRGRVSGHEASLDRIIALCRAAAEEEPEARTVQYQDRMQAHWAAPWFMDIGKLRTELPPQLRRAEAFGVGPEAETANGPATPRGTT